MIAALEKDPKYGGLFDVTHVLPAESDKVFGWRTMRQFFSFTCVRHPFEKQVSQWSFSRNKGWGAKYGVSDDGSFSDWCELLWKKRCDENFWPAIPQTRFSHYRPLNFVLRYENLQKDWRKMIVDNSIHDLPLELPWENKSEHLDWMEYANDKTKNIIGEIFELDFQKLGYKL